jgi:hypothetical protein
VAWWDGNVDRAGGDRQSAKALMQNGINGLTVVKATVRKLKAIASLVISVNFSSRCDATQEARMPIGILAFPSSKTLWRRGVSNSSRVKR